MNDDPGYLDEYLDDLPEPRFGRRQRSPRPDIDGLFNRASEGMPTKRMIHETRPRSSDNSFLRYIDDLMRVTGNKASFGAADHIEGLVNSLIYGAPVEDALGASHERTEGARDRLDPTIGGYHVPISTAAETMGSLAGYASLLPRLPLWLAGRAITPAVIPLEGTRGYLETQGGPRERLRGAYDAASDPVSWLNPVTGRGLASNLGLNSTMEGAGFGDLTPRAYMQKLMGGRDGS